MKALLDVRQLDVEIPTANGRLHAVRGVSFTTQPGESVGLVGESGCGKSLTLRAMMDLLPSPARITGGTILVDGVDVTGMSPKKRREHLSSNMAMVFQDSLTALNPTMRVGNQVAEIPLRRLGKSRSQARQRSLELLSAVGIRDPERTYRTFPHELSGGMRQRVCIAIALSAEPRLILADEPTTALDVTIQAQVLRVLGDLQRTQGMGLVLVTHDLAVVSNLCQRVAVMYGGRVVEEGPTRDVLDRPRMPYTASLLGCVPDPDAPIHRLLSIPGQPPDLLTDPSGCSFAVRCSASVLKCLEERPPLRMVADRRLSACWRADEPERWPSSIRVDVAAEDST